MKIISRIRKDVFEDYISLLLDRSNSEDWFNMHLPEDILYVDELNFIDCSGYTVINGVYKFYNRKTMLKYMHNYGITCGCERKLINGRVKFYYNGQPMTKEQYNFLSKRVDILEYNKYKGCGCAKNKR